jgi:NADH-quinone oxidoreductase subunit L
LLSGFWGLGSITQIIGGLLARLETGLLRFYVAALLLAVVLVLALGVLR